MNFTKLHREINSILEPSWPIMVAVTITIIIVLVGLVIYHDPALMAVTLTWVILP